MVIPKLQARVLAKQREHIGPKTDSQIEVEMVIPTLKKDKIKCIFLYRVEINSLMYIDLKVLKYVYFSFNF